MLITAVKKAEQSGAVVLRLYESEGTDKEVTLTCRRPIETASRANGLEMLEESAIVHRISDFDVRTGIRGFEIATLVLELC